MLIDSIRQTQIRFALLLYQNHFISFIYLLSKIFDSPSHGITRLFYYLIDVRTIFNVRCFIRTQETRTGIKIKTSFGQITSYFIKHLSIGLMSIKSCRSSMVYTNTSGNPDFFTFRFSTFGHAHQCLFTHIHTNGSIICFLSRGQRCSTSSRIRDRMSYRISTHHTSAGKLSK